MHLFVVSTGEPNMEDLESQLFSQWHSDIMMVDTPDVMYQPSLSEFYANLYAGNINFETPTSPYSNPTWLSSWFNHSGGQPVNVNLDHTSDQLFPEQPLIIYSSMPCI